MVIACNQFVNTCDYCKHFLSRLLPFSVLMLVLSVYGMVMVCYSHGMLCKMAPCTNLKFRIEDLVMYVLN